MEDRLTDHLFKIYPKRWVPSVTDYDYIKLFMKNQTERATLIINRMKSEKNIDNGLSV